MRGRQLLGVVVVGAASLTGAVPAGAESLVVVAKVNFQDEGAAIPAGYTRDFGQAFDPARGYGWVSSSSAAPLSLVGNGRERGVDPDQRRDTFVHMQLPPGSAGVVAVGRWEQALPPARYEITVVVGDPGPSTNSAHSVTAEGTPVIERFVPTTTTKLASATARVDVTDGRLTLSPAGGTNTKLAYVHVSRVDDAATPATAAVVLQPGTAGARVDGGTQGLSFEVLDMTLPQFSSGTLRQHLRTLGDGTLRIGGNSADLAFWTSTDEPAPTWATSRVTPAALTRLAALVSATGWDVLLTVNLKHFDPARAADEVAHARAALGSSLTAVEIGNEPNFYYADPARFWTDHQAYRQAIQARAAGTPIVGPGAAFSAAAFHQAFVQRAVAAPGVAALTRHFYSLSACNGAVPTLPQLLSKETYSAQKAAGKAIATDAARLGVPGLMDETNNVVCQGQPGVSDVFASALWTLSHLMAVSAEGVRTIHIHGNIRQCGTAKPDFMYYTPLCAPTAAAFTSGAVTAQPSYYGLLAFRRMGVGSHIGVDNANWASLHAFAIRNGANLSVALINVQDPAAYGPRPVAVTLNGTYRQALRIDLRTSSPSGLAAKAGTSFGGQAVRADGTFPTPTTTAVPITDGVVRLTVPAGSATILLLS